MKTVLISMAAGGLAAALAMGQTAPRYTVAEIGTLGGSASIAFGVNDAGRVAGGANLRSENQHPFLSVVGGLLYDLGTPGGPNGNMAGPNNNDQVGGLAETALLDPNGEDFCGYGTHLECRGIARRPEPDYSRRPKRYANGCRRRECHDYRDGQQRFAKNGDLHICDKRRGTG